MSRRRFAMLSAIPLFWAGIAHAGDFDLDDDDTPSTPAAASAPPPAPKRTFTLRECLELADRNHPNLWAARARVALAHGQLDEAKWVPFWQWSAQAGGGIAPIIGGTVGYTSAPATALNPTASTYEPFFTFSISGTIPLYTFGKITAAKEAGEANVRYQEWDMEKLRDLVRMDVRRAFFGTMFARDARYLGKDILQKLEKAIDGIRKKLAKGDKAVDEIDETRLVIYRDQLLARAGDPDRGETYAMAALRFFTGVPTDFDIPDKPLTRPDTALGPLVEYLSAARLYRPEVNEARAGVVARRAQLALQRARYFPDVGVLLSANYNSFPSIVPQNNFWAANSGLNSFGFGFALGARWSLDLLPNAARVNQVESQLEEARSLERYALGGIAVEVESAYANALEARKREEQWARLEHRTREWIVNTQDAIDLGTKQETALLEPLRVYIDARLNHIYSLMDVNVTMSDLARATGWDAAAPTGD
jgi:multidrug efflux system outer membrane protein